LLYEPDRNQTLRAPRRRTIRPYNLFVGPLIPVTLLQDLSLSPLAKLLFACLSMHLGKSGDRCNPRSKVLAAELGVSEDKIERALKELAGAGLVRRKSNRPWRAWETEILTADGQCL
jgi:DNA-binding MarR family transcriptional regulator